MQRIQKMAEIGHMKIPKDMQIAANKQANQRRTGRLNVHIPTHQQTNANLSPPRILDVNAQETICDDDSSDDSITNITEPQSNYSIKQSAKRIYQILSGKSPPTEASSVGVDSGENGDMFISTGASHSIPVTLAQMRDIESGDAWGNMFADDGKDNIIDDEGSDVKGNNCYKHHSRANEVEAFSIPRLSKSVGGTSDERLSYKEVKRASNPPVINRKHSDGLGGVSPPHGSRPYSPVEDSSSVPSEKYFNYDTSIIGDTNAGFLGYLCSIDGDDSNSTSLT